MGDIECMAAVCWAPNEPLSIEKIRVSAPRENEVRIKLSSTGVCHTDHYTWSGKDSEGNFPCILGHEGAGYIEAVGPGVNDLKIGDFVIPLYIPECNQCKFCRSKKTNLCSIVRESQGKGVMPDGSTRFYTAKDNKPIFHYMGTSTFAEYTVCLAISVAKVPFADPLRVCLLGCAITTGYGAALNTANVEEGSSVAVFGLGAVGLSVVQGAKARGAKVIVGIDVNSSKEAVARQLGCTDFLDATAFKTNADLQAFLVAKFDGGFDFTFECIGNPEVMRLALESCHKGWGVSTIIGVAPAGKEITTRPFMLVTGRTWKGSAFGGVKGKSQLPHLVEEYMQGRLRIDPYVSEVCPLAGINEAMRNVGKHLRSVINYDL